ncbi:glycosylphosphatidylinositol anchor biosynthesis [Saitozyma podzolica]|uniref:Mannosyltransferase n=1 Tax=Saitozyma podzolica TaxID=1890683 RepID=A0A427YEG0_9TREE|nr:glycosylphosphatidylinositol anchor biosynthesis [Saitozyma podzolica]
MIPPALVLALTVRSLSLLLPHTFFQPDEFYQAFEPAHRLVFGYGHLTWEWRDLPHVASGSWWVDAIEGGRMRGWIWPGVFAGVYKGLQLSGLDQTSLVTFAPRVIGVLVAALTDFATYRLSIKVLGAGSGAAALFLSLTSLFNAHLLPRALSTSPETLLTTLALVFFPLPRPETPVAVVIGDQQLVASKSMRDVTRAEDADLAQIRPTDAVRLKDVGEINYVVMDRIGPDVVPRERVPDSLFYSASFAALAVCIRPTTLPFWAYLGGEHVLRVQRRQGFGAATVCIVQAATAGHRSTAAPHTHLRPSKRPAQPLIVLRLDQPALPPHAVTAHHALPDMVVVGSGLRRDATAREIPPVVSAHAGSTRRIAHSCPSSRLRHNRLVPQPAFRVALPPPIPPASTFVHASPVVPILRSDHPRRLPPRPVNPAVHTHPRVSVLLDPPFTATALPVPQRLAWKSPGTGHGCSPARRCRQRDGLGGSDALSLNAVDECSAQGRPGVVPHVRATIGTQQSLFYASPVSYFETVFPYPPNPLHRVFDSQETPDHPSHLLLFGSVLDKTEIANKRGIVDVRDSLRALGYREVWRGWNGFDLLQDEAERRGGVRIWAKEQ